MFREKVDCAGMYASHDTPEPVLVHESQMGPESPYWSATTACIIETADTMVGYGLPLTSIMPKLSFSPSPVRPLTGSSTYWNQSSPTSQGASSYRGAK